MSATMTLTQSRMATTTPFSISAAACLACPECGFDLPPIDTTQIALLDAQRQIDDLHSQVRLLNQKAATAVDRWADYEDELSKLRSQISKQQQQQPPAQPQPQPQLLPTPPPPPSPSRASFLSTGAATRISALLSPRRSTPSLKTPPPPPQTPPPPVAGAAASSPDTPSTADLLQALSREQSLRRVAEGKLDDTSREVEELSVSLFEQANEMVATERRARARLEERVELLERRDVEKRARLERLEQAMSRIERVRALLGETAN